MNLKKRNTTGDVKIEEKAESKIKTEDRETMDISLNPHVEKAWRRILVGTFLMINPLTAKVKEEPKVKGPTKDAAVDAARLAAMAAAVDENAIREKQLLARRMVNAHKENALQFRESQVAAKAKQGEVNRTLREETGLTHEEAGVRPPKAKQGSDRRTMRTRQIIDAALSPASPGAFASVTGLAPNTIKANQVIVSAAIMDKQGKNLDEGCDRVVFRRLKRKGSGLPTGGGSPAMHLLGR